MKKIFLALIGFMLVFAACNNETETTSTTVNGEEIDAVITAVIPQNIPGVSSFASYNYNSGLGGLTNVDNTKYKLRYILQIRSDKDKDNTYETVVFDEAEAVDPKIGKVSFSARLVRGVNYQFTAWADFTLIGATTEKKDLHYKTTAGLDQIELMTASEIIINDDSKDAYFAHDVKPAQGIISLTLQRPLAKIRMIATDYETLDPIGENLTDVMVTYSPSKQLYTQFNAFTGDVAGKKAIPAPTGLIAAPAIDKANEGLPNEKTVYWDYLFAPVDNSVSPAIKTALPVAFTLSYKGTAVKTHSVSNSKVVVKRNALTTIRTACFSGTFSINLDINEEWDEYINPLETGIKLNTTDYPTLAGAMADAGPGDAVTIPEGTFAGDLVVKSGVKLIGRGATSVITGQLTLEAGSTLKNVKSFYNGSLRNAVEVRGAGVTIDGVTLETNRKKGVAPSPYNGEAIHGDNSVINLTVTNCTFNSTASANYWKGIYLNINDGLAVTNNTFYRVNPFGVDHYNTSMTITGNTFDRSSLIGDTQMIHIADQSLSGDGSDVTTWTTQLIDDVKQIKSQNTWLGSQLTGTKCQPVRVKTKYAGGKFDETWTFYN